METHNPYAAPKTSPAPEPEQLPDGQLDLADRGSRFAAYLLDFVILIGIFVVLGIVFAVIFFTSKSAGEIPDLDAFVAMAESPLFSLGSVAIGIVVTLAVNGYFWATRSQSLGKMVVGIKIVRTDGSKPSLGRLIFYRYLVLTVLGSIPIIGLVALIDPLLIFRDQRNCLHDDIADTRVVRVPPKQIPV